MPPISDMFVILWHDDRFVLCILAEFERHQTRLACLLAFVKYICSSNCNHIPPSLLTLLRFAIAIAIAIHFAQTHLLWYSRSCSGLCYMMRRPARPIHAKRILKALPPSSHRLLLRYLPVFEDQDTGIHSVVLASVYH